MLTFPPHYFLFQWLYLYVELLLDVSKLWHFFIKLHSLLLVELVLFEFFFVLGLLVFEFGLEGFAFVLLLLELFL